MTTHALLFILAAAVIIQGLALIWHIIADIRAVRRLNMSAEEWNREHHVLCGANWWPSSIPGHIHTCRLDADHEGDHFCVCGATYHKDNWIV